MKRINIRNSFSFAFTIPLLYLYLSILVSYFVKGALDPVKEHVSVARYKHWSNIAKCPGREANEVCILTVFHLPYLVRSVALFANKFHSGYHPLAYSCLEELIADKVRAEVMGMNAINLTYYRNLPFVLHHRN